MASQRTRGARIYFRIIPPSLEHHEYSLHILPSTFSRLCKEIVFPTTRIRYSLHKRHPLRIDIIDKVMPHVVVVPVDSVVVRRSFPITKYFEQRRSLEYIDVIVRTRHAKESMPNPQVLRCHCFKYDNSHFYFALQRIFLTPCTHPRRPLSTTLTMHEHHHWRGKRIPGMPSCPFASSCCNAPR